MEQTVQTVWDWRKHGHTGRRFCFRPLITCSEEGTNCQKSALVCSWTDPEDVTTAADTCPTVDVRYTACSCVSLGGLWMLRQSSPAPRKHTAERWRRELGPEHALLRLLPFPHSSALLLYVPVFGNLVCSEVHLKKRLFQWKSGRESFRKRSNPVTFTVSAKSFLVHVGGWKHAICAYWLAH